MAATAAALLLPLHHFPRAHANLRRARARALALAHGNLPLPFAQLNSKGGAFTSPAAYVTGQASDPILSDPSFMFEASSSDEQRPLQLITWSLLWSLVLKHKLRLGIAILTLVACSASTLSMPLFSGNPLPNALYWIPLFVSVIQINCDVRAILPSACGCETGAIMESAH